LVRTFNGRMMFCLQIEDKILPASVVRQELKEKIKKMEQAEDRRLRQSEKNTYKDELYMTLLPRAFSRFTRLYAYIDTAKKWLVVSTTNVKKYEQFISMLVKATQLEVSPVSVLDLSHKMTRWLKNQDYPAHFSVETSGVLMDPDQVSRVIRCQHQDLFAPGIQTLIGDGCEVTQLGLCWQDRISFVLQDNFTLRSLKCQEELVAQMNEMEAETKQQRFDADFIIMSETFSQLLTDLLTCLCAEETSLPVNRMSAA